MDSVTLPLLGGIGVGLVWGFLLGSLGRGLRRTAGSVFTAALATAGVGGVVALVAPGTSPVAFLVATAVALWARLAWTESLVARSR